MNQQWHRHGNYTNRPQLTSYRTFDRFVAANNLVTQVLQPRASRMLRSSSTEVDSFKFRVCVTFGLQDACKITLVTLKWMGTQYEQLSMGQERSALAILRTSLCPIQIALSHSEGGFWVSRHMVTSVALPGFTNCVIFAMWAPGWHDAVIRVTKHPLSASSPSLSSCYYIWFGLNWRA